MKKLINRKYHWWLLFLCLMIGSQTIAQSPILLKELGLEGVELEEKILDSLTIEQERAKWQNLPNNHDDIVQIVEPEKPISNSRNTRSDHTILFYLYCALLAFYGYINWQYGGGVKAIRRFFISFRLSRQSFEEGISEMLLPLIASVVNTSILLGVFIYYFFKHFEIFSQLNYWQLLILAIGLTCLLLVIKYLVQMLLSYTLPETDTIQFYVYNKMLIYSVLGVVLLPPLMLLSFSSIIPSIYWLLAALIIIAVFVVILAYRGILVSRKLIQFYPFHFFLYLCALEIAPVLVLWSIYQTL